MKRLLVLVGCVLVGAVAGMAAMFYGFPQILPHQVPAARVGAIAYAANQAVAVGFTGVQSNLAEQQHYVNFDVTFMVMPKALEALGGKASSSGTGNPLLNARIRNGLLNLARSTSFSQLTAPGGVATFKKAISVTLQAIFGPGTIGHVYLPKFLVQ